VYVDGVLKGSATVESTNTYAGYPIALSGLAAGSHTLKESYENDFSTTTCDRNAYLDYLVLGQPELQSGTRAGNCRYSLQAIIDAATAGDTLYLNACTYRERVTINKSLTIVGADGAKIKGSDIVSSWRALENGIYRSNISVPTCSTGGYCQSATRECQRPEQVYVSGVPLTQVGRDTKPAAGQFSLDSERRVVLGQDPAGRTVQVTMRDGWVVGGASGVTINNVDMHHAANPPQYDAALKNGGYSNWTVKNSNLSEAHGAVVSFSQGKNLRIVNNNIHHGGQLGIHSCKGTADIIGNKIHHNNVADFDSAWEAGGVKQTFQRHNTVSNNEVYANNGTGRWCDIKCEGTTYSNNRIHHNGKSAIFHEISDDAKIFGNVVWENGHKYDGGAWTGAVRATNTRNVEIYGNTVAWDQSGISVLSTDRFADHPETNRVYGNTVHDNIVLAQDFSNSLPTSSCSRSLALAYCQTDDFGLFSSANNNGGYGNDYYYYATPESAPRYKWDSTGYASLRSFNPTPGEERGHYLSQSEKNAVAAKKDIPPSPEPS
jgi:hypothetical protein